MTGPLELPGDPVLDLQAATKAYVDANSGGGGGGGGIPATTVTSETLFGLSPAVGIGTKYARDDHTHGSPAAPTPGSIGAATTGHNHAGTYDPAGSAASALSVANSNLATHESDTTNVHGIVDTSQLTTSSQLSSGLSGKENTIAAGTTSDYWRGDKSWQTLNKAAVGLASVDNTSDASKPVSTATQTALDLKAPIASPTFTGTVSGITKAMVGLGSVDNTADTAKPVSTAQQTALDLKAPLASPAFTGTPSLPTGTTAVTQSAGNNTTAVATTAFVAALGALKANLASPTFTGTPAAPTAAAGTSTTQIATTAFVTTADNLKAPLASPTFTGVPAAPTAAQGTNTTQVATTAYVQTEAGLLVPRSLIDAKGDLLAGTADNTIARLPVGANGTFLMADSAQSTGLTWGTPVVTGGGGGSSAGLPDNIRPRTGSWYAIPTGRVSSNLTMALNRMYFAPFPIGDASVTWSDLSFELITVGAAGAVVRAVIWDSTTSRQPNVSLADLGTVATDAGPGTAKQWNSLARALSANTLYWVGLVAQTATCIVRAIGAYNAYAHDTTVLTGTGEVSGLSMTGVSGAVANGTSFVFASGEAVPRMAVKFA